MTPGSRSLARGVGDSPMKTPEIGRAALPKWDSLIQTPHDSPLDSVLETPHASTLTPHASTLASPVSYVQVCVWMCLHMSYLLIFPRLVQYTHAVSLSLSLSLSTTLSLAGSFSPLPLCLPPSLPPARQPTLPPSLPPFLPPSLPPSLPPVNFSHKNMHKYTGWQIWEGGRGGGFSIERRVSSQRE